jgi:hypothetical protein
MTQKKHSDITKNQSCKTGVKRGILNISLEEICKDTRSLTRIANLVLDKQNLSFTRITNKPLIPKIRKFNSNDLCFNYIVENENKFTSNHTYIMITHKKRNHLVENWKIYIFQDDFYGIKIKLLEYVNYTWIKNQDLIGNFIKSKKWINQEVIDYEIREINRQIESLNSKKRILETFCS